MLASTILCADLRVEVFHDKGSEHANQDRWFVQQQDSYLRVAAIDGVTPWRTPSSPGDDAAQWAAAMTVGALALPLGADAALRHANRLIHCPEVVPSRRQAMAAAAVADCRQVGNSVSWSGVVAADCEIWVADSRESALRLVLGGDFVRPDVGLAWGKQLASHRMWSLDERLAAEAELFDDPTTQIRHAVGRYPIPVFDYGAGAAGVIVLSSDGARMLEAERQGVSVSELSAWLQDVVDRSPRDDLTCVVVEAAVLVD